MKHALLLLAFALGLGACTGESVERTLASSFKSWCKSAENCTVHPEK